MSGLSSFSLAGKNALVTGAGRGLGAAMARGLAEAGGRVALVSRSEAELTATATEIGASAVAIPADVSDPSTYAGLLDRAEDELGGPIDIVLHAAGVQRRASAEDVTIDDWNTVITTNLTAPYFLSQEVARRQLATGRAGSHIFVGSLTSHLSVSGISAYTASKSGIYGVLRAFSTEWSSRGIRANGIGPGYIRTELTRALIDDPERGPRLLDRIPMGRLGSPEDMAGAAVFLASDASSYISGQLLMVDGGWSAS
ncbi:MAG: NAD(P)-dependent short chain dehydrogenase [Subtercola sp.]|nr:NAD(P)-dependent short chain dehydrogenase [Subtercola sp.]